ncbi:MAG: pyridoxamine 5'-phosphate oxidase family protein [Pseudomonadota bacterium]
MESFGALMFDDAVQAEQERQGTRAQNERLAARVRFAQIGPDEQTFIETRTTAYLATNGADGWPYVQHRGGPSGFIKVLGPDEIAFAEYPGNRQFITLGRLGEDARVSLILMDYPQRARLKLLGTAEITKDSELLGALTLPEGVTATRALRIKIAALDWNCPKYITRRFTEHEIAHLVGPELQRLQDRIAALEAELAART